MWPLFNYFKSNMVTSNVFGRLRNAICAVANVHESDEDEKCSNISQNR